ncbi:MAG: hydroxyacid dehydrogenase [Chthoniobacteraceae bacterium]
MKAEIPVKALKKAAFFGGCRETELVYAQGRFDKVARITDLYPHIVDLDHFAEHAAALRDVEVIFSTWNMPVLTPAHLDQLPALKIVFYAAGTVQYFASPFLERGITVVSAWKANAIPVAEFTASQIVLAMKGYFRNVREYRGCHDHRKTFVGIGNFGETVAILGAGAIGRRVIKLLHPYQLRIVVFDPFLDPSDAARLGVEKVSLEEAFEKGYVVSNHIANLPETHRMLNGALFQRMRPDATFINTGRGITVDEPSMLEVLGRRPDLSALIDVTYPESPEPQSPLFTLPNVFLSSHIAGSMGDEVVRMADYCIEEFMAWEKGRPLHYAISLDMLKTMA